MEFPDKVFVTIEEPKNEPYLNIREDTDTVDDGETVAVYELREKLVKRVSHTLEPKA